MKNCIKNMKKRIKLKKTRTTVNVSEELMKKAFGRMQELRRPSFSNYVEDLIANDLKNGEAVAA